MASGIGIDLGAHSIRVVELRVSDRGATVPRALVLDRSTMARDGVDTSERRQVLAYLKKEMSLAGISTKEVALSISGKDSIIRYTHVPPVPAWRLKVIMDYEVGEVAEKIGEKLSSDYNVLPITRESDDDQTIIIGLAKELVLDSLLDDLQSVGITVAKAIPAPLALYTSYAAFGEPPDMENPEDELVVVVDIGAENLHMAFLFNGNLAFARSASFGGKNFTEAVAREIGVDAAHAEKIKLKGGTLEIGGGGRFEAVVNPLRGVATQILSAIQSSLKYSRMQIGVNFPAPARFVILGGGASLNGLDSYLQAGLQRPVEFFRPRASPSPDISAEATEEFSATPGNFAVALGLAASMVRREGFELSLLPTKYRERRWFWDRTLFLYLAAAFLTVFLGINLAQGLTERSQAMARKSDLTAAKNDLDRYREEMNQNIDENAMTKARINRILKEAELGAFEAFVLSFLARQTGPELMITRWNLIEEEEEGGEPVYLIQIDGAADNVTKRALGRIEALEAGFAAESRVARVESHDIHQVGKWYQFQMILEPNYQSYR